MNLFSLIQFTKLSQLRIFLLFAIFGFKLMLVYNILHYFSIYAKHPLINLIY